MQALHLARWRSYLIRPQHGIAPGYYISFFFFAFVQTTGRLARTYLRPVVLPANYVPRRDAPPPPQTTAKQIYDYLGTIITVSFMNYGAVPFMLLTIDDSFVAWNNVMWYGHFLVVGALVFFYCGGCIIIQEIQEVRLKEAGFKKQREELNRLVTSGSATPTTQSEAPTLPPLDEAMQELKKELRDKKES